MRLIDADELLKKQYEAAAYNEETECFGLPVVEVKDIENAPTINPEDLRPRGRWILTVHKENANYRWHVTAECSECCNKKKKIWAGFFPNVPDDVVREVAMESAISLKLSNYCPDCGAKMEKEE